ncbi:MAG: methylated-DNA--[protein]-cysteine S-methyltransferase [Opitutaceae bacterium]|nr:methylated-DNA--[protein]-cysteine S-methyltransferase [Verrucomicrobiales bacterium]
MHTLQVITKDGSFAASYSEHGLHHLDFPGKPGLDVAKSKATVTPQIRDWHRLTETAVHAVLAGRAIPSLPPLDLSSGTDFQRRVWTALQRIRAGETESYGGIARKLGANGATRAVGGACGANPIPLLIPCHRVLAAHQRLGGFSGGLNWKRKLLEREGVTFST